MPRSNAISCLTSSCPDQIQIDFRLQPIRVHAEIRHHADERHAQTAAAFFHGHRQRRRGLRALNHHHRVCVSSTSLLFFMRAEQDDEVARVARRFFHVRDCRTNIPK